MRKKAKIKGERKRWRDREGNQRSLSPVLQEPPRRKRTISLSCVSDHFLVAKRHLARAETPRACRDPDVSAFEEFTRVRSRVTSMLADANAPGTCTRADRLPSNADQSLFDATGTRINLCRMCTAAIYADRGNFMTKLHVPVRRVIEKKNCRAA